MKQETRDKSSTSQQHQQFQQRWITPIGLDTPRDRNERVVVFSPSSCIDQKTYFSDSYDPDPYVDRIFGPDAEDAEDENRV